MKLAIMQPYLFPYIGYFQLIHAVNKFVIYDDVNYIKQGWINRNRILISGKPAFITVPIKNASSFEKINNVVIANDSKKNWKSKWKKTFYFSYAKAPQFRNVYSFIEPILDQDIHYISELATSSIKAICSFLKISTTIANNPTPYKNNHLNGEDRVIDICHQESCHEYINASGGVNLYSRENFYKKNIQLKFLYPQSIEYKQFHYPFSPWLSIIDVLMHNEKEKVQHFLCDYHLS